MKNLLITISFTLLLTALPMFAQEKNNATPKKTDSAAPKMTAKPTTAEDLYSRWEKLKKDAPTEAAKIAAEYVENFPDEKSENAQTLKKWLDDYEKTTNIASAKTDHKTEVSDKSKLTARETADKKDSAAGIWTIVVTTQQGDLQFALTLKQDGKNLSGSVKSFYGNGTVKSGTIDGNIINLDLQAKPLEVKLNGTVDGDQMKGSVTANIPNIPELKFVGTRAKEAPTQK